MKNTYMKQVQDVLTKLIDGYKRGLEDRNSFCWNSIDMLIGKIPMANAYRDIQTKTRDRDRKRRIVTNVGVRPKCCPKIDR